MRGSSVIQNLNILILKTSKSSLNGVRFIQSTAATSSRFGKNATSGSDGDHEQGNTSHGPEKSPFDVGEWGLRAEVEPVTKITQRFKRDPSLWQKDEQAFGVAEHDLVGRVLTQADLRPERAFAMLLPSSIGLVAAAKYLYKSFRTKVYYVGYKDTGIFHAPTVVAGAKKAFEVISQAAYEDNLDSLVTGGICSQEMADRFAKAGSHMSRRQRDLFNLTEEDVFGIAPGVLGPFQNVQQRVKGEGMYVTYSVLTCALYKKKLLYDAVKDVPLLEGDEVENAEQLPMPKGYGFTSPRIIFGYLTFGNKIVGNKKLDPEVGLFDFQYLVF